METGEQVLFSALEQMLADRGYLFPLAAAQRQFRTAYYGMSAAAMLEDLFFDAFSHYLREHQPTARLARPPRGMRGWDYEFEGTQVSHKVGRGPTQIAALWDATRTDLATWTFDSTVLFTSSEYSPATRCVRLHDGGAPTTLSALTGAPDEVVKAQRCLVALRWEPSGAARLLGVWQAERDTTVTALLPFTDLWQAMTRPEAAGAPANTLEVLHATTATAARQVTALSQQPTLAGGRLQVEAVDLRPGLYLLAQDLLQDVPVGTNNRAVLVARDTVAGLMRQAAGSGLFAPLPTWFAAWAPDRPPNLYLTQRAQYVEMFTGT